MSQDPAVQMVDDDDDEDEIIVPSGATQSAAAATAPRPIPQTDDFLDDDDILDDDDDDDDDDEVISPPQTSTVPAAAVQGAVSAEIAPTSAEPANDDDHKEKPRRRRKKPESGLRMEHGRMTIAPSFNHLLGGKAFSGLVVDQTCVFHFTVDEPQRVEKKKGVLTDSYYTYRTVTTSTMPEFLSMPKQYSDLAVRLKKDGPEIEDNSVRRFAVARRYNDFAWLRDQLERDHPGIPISPLPEKSTRAAMDKFLEGGGGEMNNLLEYRQRGLRKFLISIGANWDLANSEHVRAFLTLVREPIMLPRGATVTSTPGASAQLEGAAEDGATPELRATDFTTFTAYRDAVNAQVDAYLKSRGEGTVGRRIEAIGNFFSKKFSKDAQTSIRSTTSLETIDLMSEKQYFTKFRDCISDMREYLHFMREAHKDSLYAYRHLSFKFKQLSKDEATSDPLLFEEFETQGSLWAGMALLQHDLLDAESKMVMDGLFNYYNWASEIVSVLNDLDSINSDIQQMSKKSHAGAEALRLNDLRSKRDRGVESLLREMQWFHKSKLHDWRAITAAFIAIHSTYSARQHAVFSQSS